MGITKLLTLADKAMSGIELPSTSQVWAVVLIGLAVVFSALIILIAFVWIMGKFFTIGNSKKKPAAPQNKPTAIKPAPKKNVSAAKASASSDDDEVIAVIAAAVAAMGKAEGKTYKVKSVRAVNQSAQRPAWAAAGLQSNTAPF